MEIESLCLSALWRPRGIPPPYIGAGLEDIGLRKFGVAVVFEILLEERKQNIFPVIVAGAGSELHPPQVLAVEPRPPAVHPWTDHERVEDSGIVLVDGVECAARTLQ